LGDPLYIEYLGPAFDRNSMLDPHSLIAAVSQIIAGLHKDGTLSKLCMQWEGSDLAAAAATFDARSLESKYSQKDEELQNGQLLIFS